MLRMQRSTCMGSTGLYNLREVMKWAVPEVFTNSCNEAKSVLKRPLEARLGSS